LLEVFEEVGRAVEQMSDLAVNVLDRLRFALISLQDFKELFVDVWMSCEAILLDE